MIGLKISSVRGGCISNTCFKLWVSTMKEFSFLNSKSQNSYFTYLLISNNTMVLLCSSTAYICMQMCLHTNLYAHKVLYGLTSAFFNVLASFIVSNKTKHPPVWDTAALHTMLTRQNIHLRATLRELLLNLRSLRTRMQSPRGLLWAARVANPSDSMQV